jgi:OOP family OmpA-OmpF porin
MKKLIVGLSISAAVVFANVSDLSIGGGIGRTHVQNAPIEKYNFGNIRINKKINNNDSLRFELEKAPSVHVYGEKKQINRFILNYEKALLPNEKIYPYVFIGGGYQIIKGIYPNRGIADAGLGIKINLNKKSDIFFEVRELRDFANNDNHYSYLGGLEFKFGRKTSQISNETSKITHKIVYIDSDFDGVPDNLDKCPNTPHGVKVDKNGCPIDSDHDGVPDYLDKCPNTPSGVKVDKNGCPVSFTFVIEFDTNSYKIKPQYLPEIKKFAQFLKENPAYKAEIQGYTDNVGNPLYNKVLSLKRAKAVYEALIAEGIDKERLSFVGYGEENPVCTQNTPECRAKNRRVVAKLYF